jgi:hypothetical protein
MPKPTVGDVHVNRPLTNISIAMIQDESNFVAGDVFPILPVGNKTDQYFSYDSAYWDRDEAKERAPGTESEGNGYSIDASPTYSCRVYAFHRDIDDQIRANADSPINLDQEATRYVTLKMLLRREKAFAANYITGGVWTRDFDGVASSPGANQVLQWNDRSSTPIEDVWDAKAAILERTGFEPNVLVLGYTTYKTLVNHPDFVDRVKYGQSGLGAPAMIDTSDLAQLFKVPKVVIMKAGETTSAEGAAARTRAFIGGGKNALLAYAAPAPGLMTPTAGYIFSWTGYLGAGPAGNRIKRFRMEHLSSDRVEGEIAIDMKLVAADLGAFWDTVVA